MFNQETLHCGRWFRTPALFSGGDKFWPDHPLPFFHFLQFLNAKSGIVH
jgi:hypothetical protein